MKIHICNNYWLSGLFFLSLFLLIPSSLFAQSETEIRAIIEEGDLKKLLKADESKNDADALIEEANGLNMEIFNVQSDPDLDEDDISKRTAKLEKQAVDKQIKASALYEKSNEAKVIIYKSYIDAFWKEHEGEESDYINAKLLEEQANDIYFQATSYRIDAKRMDNGYAKVEKLTEANNLENEAVQKQLTALAAYYNIVIKDDTLEIPEEPYTPSVPVNASDELQTQPNTAPVNTGTGDQTIPAQVEVNQSMIDMYNEYLENGQLTDPELSTSEIAGITEFDRERLLEIWNNYYFEQGAVEPETLLAETVDTTQAADEIQPSEIAEQPAAESTEIGVVTEENRSTIVPADEEVIYRIQVAANKTQLSQRALSRMYYGNKNVEMINEDGWYKYSVGDFETFEEADDFRRSSMMDNSFIVAYRKGTRFASVPGETAETAVDQVVSVEESGLPGGLIFRIQVAASRVPLTITQLQRIYPGKYPIEMIYEDNWYKYQFIGVRLYSDAISIIRNVSTRGVFIVAYEDGIKADLATAVKQNKSLENLVRTQGRRGNVNDIEYHLQLAASRIAMKPDEINMIYSGSEPVTVILEDGWYKYHLKAGNSPELAEELKQACGIEKAFIVPYSRAAKITYYEALQQNR